MGIDLQKTRACLLAGGNGKRAGGPKAWQEYHGLPLLERQLEFLLKIFEPEAVSVSIQEAWIERCLKLNSKIHWIAVNPNEPPMASLIALERVLSPATSAGARNCAPSEALRPAPPAQLWTFVYHVDIPVWEKDLWMKLAEEATDDFAAIMPRYQNKGGHPVLLSPSAQKAILKLDPHKDRLDFWLHSQNVKMVDVPYSVIHENWNQPIQS